MTTPIVPTPTQHENDELVTQQFEGTLPSAPWHHAMDGSAIDPQSPDPTPKTTSWPSDEGGGGGAYVAKAVHFDGSTWLVRNSALSGIPDSGLLTFSLWARSETQPPSPQWYLFDIDPPGIEAGLEINEPGTHGGSLQGQWPGPPINLSANDIWTVSTWHHVFGVLNTNMAAHSKLIKVLLDGVDVTGTITDTGAARTFPFGSCGWAVPDDTDNLPSIFVGDYADVWIAPGVYNVDVTIFRDPATGKPKNPSGFPSSAILFSGDAATFATNKGIGGAFTLTGALTDATTSPSDGVRRSGPRPAERSGDGAEPDG